MANWDNLIEKYLEGETNLLEEKALRNYFLSGKAQDNHKPYAALFLDPEESLLEEMDADPFAKIDFEAKKRSIDFRRILSIAASLLILVFVGVSVIKTNNNNQAINELSSFEPQSEEEAYEQTLIALELLSKKFNGGKTSVEQGIEGLKKASEIINK